MVNRDDPLSIIMSVGRFSQAGQRENYRTDRVENDKNARRGSNLDATPKGAKLRFDRLALPPVGCAKDFFHNGWDQSAPRRPPALACR